MSFNMNEYQKEYKKGKYDRIALEVPKGKREEIKEYARNKGFKLNAYIKKLIQEDSGIDLSDSK